MKHFNWAIEPAGYALVVFIVFGMASYRRSHKELSLNDL